MKLEPNEIQTVEWEQAGKSGIPVWNRTRKVLFVYLTSKGVEIMEG